MDENEHFSVSIFEKRQTIFFKFLLHMDRQHAFFPMIQLLWKCAEIRVQLLTSVKLKEMKV